MYKPSFETLVLIMGVVAIVLLISFYNINGTVVALSSLNLYYIALTVVVFFVYMLLKFLPWTYILRKIHLRISKLQSLMMMYGFFGMGLVPTSIGQFLPLRYLDQFKRNARFFSLGIILALGATSGLALLLVTLIAALFVSMYIPYIIALFAISYVFTSIIGMKRVNGKVPNLINRWLNPKKHKIFRSLLDYANNLKKHQSFLSQRDILSETLLFIPSLISEGLMLYFILLALGQGLSVVDALFIFGVSVTIGNMSLLPAGLGAMDTTMVAFLLLFGVAGAISITVTIIFRFLNTFAVFLLGYSSLLYLKLHFPGGPTKKRK